MREMGSREKTTPHQLSSLVVRPSDNGGGGANGDSTGGASSDYEPGEVRSNDPPPYFRSDRFADSHGHRMRASSVSPVRRMNADHRYSDHSGGPPRGRGFGRGRGRYRDYSPPYGRGRDGGRFFERGFDGPGRGSGPLRGGAMPRSIPNVRPREGDWLCPDPLCNNLNFARRESCNNCKRPRYAPAGSPRRAFPGSPPPTRRRFPGPAMDRSPGRFMNDYRSPPRGWARNGPRDFRPGGPPRYEGRFPDPPIRRDRPDYREDDYRKRNMFDRPIALDWDNRERERDNFFNDRKMYERRPQSPPLLPPEVPPRGLFDRDIRERSRSPVRGTGPLIDYRRNMYLERGRENRRGMGRGVY